MPLLNKDTAPRFALSHGFLAVAIALLIGGCSTPRVEERPAKILVPTQQRFEQQSWRDLSGWEADRLADVWTAFTASCRALRFRAEWSAPCTAANGLSDPSEAAIREYFQQYFDPI